MKYLVTQRDQQTVLGSGNDYDMAKRSAEGRAKEHPGIIFDVFEIKASAQCKVLDPYIIEVVK